MSALYPIVLVLHSILRWVVIVLAAFVLIRAYRGWLGRKPWTGMDGRAGLLFTISLDLQVLFGLLLYFFLSPITTSALQNFSGAMTNTATRYFLVEHSLVMLVALIIAHIGRSLSRRATEDNIRHKRAAIFYTLAVLIMLVAIPWPFLNISRPWIRF